MIVSINQPAYLPWLGYFDRIARSDIHIVLDHVQFEKNSMVNRNKIRAKKGWIWLTVPLKTKGRFGKLAINALQVSDQTPWAQKHLRSIRNCYNKAPYFSNFFPSIERSLAWGVSGFFPMIDGVTKLLCKKLGIQTQILYSSELNPKHSKSSLVLELCRKVDATTYISGPFGREYLDAELFAANSIDVLYHDYVHPKYRQLYAGFESHMSVVDLMFNHGPASLAMLSDPSPLAKE